MPSFDEMFMANIECTMQDIRLREDLDRALDTYNDLFIPGSAKRLKLVSEAVQMMPDDVAHLLTAPYQELLDEVMRSPEVVVSSDD